MLDLLNNWLALVVWSAWVVIEFSCNWAQPYYWHWKFSHLLSWSGVYYCCYRLTLLAELTLWQISHPCISCQVLGKEDWKVSSGDWTNDQGRALPEQDGLMVWLSCPHSAFLMKCSCQLSLLVQKKGIASMGTGRGMIIPPLSSNHQSCHCLWTAG